MGRLRAVDGESIPYGRWESWKRLRLGKGVSRRKGEFLWNLRRDDWRLSRGELSTGAQKKDFFCMSLE